MRRIDGLQSQPFPEDPNIGPKHLKMDPLKKTHFAHPKNIQEEPGKVIDEITQKVWTYLRNWRELKQLPNENEFKDFLDSSFYRIEEFRKNLTPIEREFVSRATSSWDFSYDKLKQKDYDNFEGNLILSLASLSTAKKSMELPSGNKPGDVKVRLIYAHELSILVSQSMSMKPGHFNNLLYEIRNSILLKSIDRKFYEDAHKIWVYLDQDARSKDVDTTLSHLTEVRHTLEEIINQYP